MWSFMKKASQALPAMLSGFFGNKIPSPVGQLGYLQAYSANPWIYTPVWIIATSIAQTPFYMEDEEGERVEEEHPVVTFLKNPNPEMEAFDFWEASLSLLELGGEVFWEIVTDKLTIPRDLWPLRPDRMSLTTDSARKAITGYQYKIKNDVVEFLEDEIIQVKYFHPTDDWRGHSSIEALTDTLNAESYAMRWFKRFLRRFGVTEGYLQTDQRPGQTEVSRLRQQWSKKNTDDEDLTPMLPAGLKFTELAKPIKEAGLFEALKLIRETELAALGVPPVLAGLLEYARYSNYDLQLRSFVMMTCVPKLLKLESAINRKLVPRFTNVSLPKDKYKGKLRLVFDRDKIGFVSMELLAKIAMELADRAAATPNDLVDITGIGSKWKGGDERMLGERKKPADAADSNNTKPLDGQGDAESDEDEKEKE